MVVGLGNPGAQYANTRHNVGHMLVDLLAANAGVQLVAHRSGTHCADIRLGMLPGGVPGPRVILAISDSYMNTSGGPIGRLAKFMNVAPSRLLVVHDDLDLPEGTLRLKTGGGEGGHNGLKSISQVLGTRDYNRLRIGIGRPPGRMNQNQLTELAVTIAQAGDVVEDIVTTSFSEAQQRLHTQQGA